jgi:hypothetical protein
VAALMNRCCTSGCVTCGILRDDLRITSVRELRGDLIAAETAELARLFDDGTISSITRQRLQ